MKKAISFVIIAAVVFIVAVIGFSFTGCRQATVSDTTTVMTKAAAETEAVTKATVNTTPTTPESISNVGDNVNFKGTIITAIKFTKSNVGYLNNPQEGFEYVIVTVKIKNGTDSNIYYQPHDFKMQDSKGQITQVNLESTLSSGELDPNGEVEGTVVFEEPKNDPELTLIYQPYLPSKSGYDSEFIKIIIR